MIIESLKVIAKNSMKHFQNTDNCVIGTKSNGPCLADRALSICLQFLSDYSISDDKYKAEFILFSAAFEKLSNWLVNYPPKRNGVNLFCKYYKRCINIFLNSHIYSVV